MLPIKGVKQLSCIRYLVACHCRQDEVKMHVKVQLPVADHGSRRSVLKFPNVTDREMQIKKSFLSA